MDEWGAWHAQDPSLPPGYLFGKLCGNVFERVPEWALREVPGARGIWAPDISYFRGTYRLYYSVSTFGKNQSVIGLMTNRTLDPGRADYRWVDEGRVVGSTVQDDWNAIDPNLAVDEHGDLWLAWGSFWGGIKMRRVDPASGKLSRSDATLYSLASRPYAGRDGEPMMEGGGTLLVEGTDAWRGPGHPAVLLDPDADLLVFHAYDGTTGRPALQISTMAWEHAWPRVGRASRERLRDRDGAPPGAASGP